MHSMQAAFDILRHGGLIIYPLLALALLALLVALDKLYVHFRYVRLPAAMVDLIEAYEFSWNDLSRQLKALGMRNYFACFFHVIMENRNKPAWWVESRAGDEAYLIQQSLGRGLWLLETIVTAAPLLGLLGTIDGMMDAFKLIGNAGQVDPSGITGGVAQALIATALGLVIAIPSLFAFNYFSTRQANTIDEMERLGTRLIDHIRMNEQMASGVSREAA